MKQVDADKIGHALRVLQGERPSGFKFGMDGVLLDAPGAAEDTERHVANLKRDRRELRQKDIDRRMARMKAGYHGNDASAAYDSLAAWVELLFEDLTDWQAEMIDALAPGFTIKTNYRTPEQNESVEKAPVEDGRHYRGIIGNRAHTMIVDGLEEFEPSEAENAAARAYFCDPAIAVHVAEEAALHRSADTAVGRCLVPDSIGITTYGDGDYFREVSVPRTMTTYEALPVGATRIGPDGAEYVCVRADFNNGNWKSELQEVMRYDDKIRVDTRHASIDDKGNITISY